MWSNKYNQLKVIFAHDEIIIEKIYHLIHSNTKNFNNTDAVNHNKT